MNELTGGCGCGAVRYRLAREPMFVNCCHCTYCQRETGSAFVMNAVCETSIISVEQGAPVATPIPSESGRPHDVYRCPDCKVALWSDYGRRPALRFVRVGTLETSLTPQAHIFVRSKVRWLALDGIIPTFEAYYDMKTLWPADSLARRAALGL